MPAIYIETIPLGNDKYEFMHTVKIGADHLGDNIVEYEALDRLHAATINLGLACRWLNDNYPQPEWKNNSVEIASDKDGKDIKYGGEHDILYSLICPSTDYQAQKHNSLYGEYEKYLKRIYELIRANQIKIKLVKENDNE